MKTGKVWGMVAQGAVGLLLAAELAYLVCLSKFILPAAIRTFEDLEVSLPRSMLVVLNAANFVHHYVALLIVIVLICAVAWTLFEVVCRSEAKQRIRLAVGGSLALVLAIVALWISLVILATLVQVGRPVNQAVNPPALQVLASLGAPADVA